MQRRTASVVLATIFTTVLSAALAACSGIPLSSIPRLLKLQNELLSMDPAEFMLAIQADARMTPPAGAAPVMHLVIKPAREGAFDVVDRQLPMRLITPATGAAGLASAPPQRRWLLYSFAPEAQADLARVQTTFKRIQAERSSSGGGSVAVGIAQEGVAVDDPAFAHTRWESWLRTSRKDGFFELWSGTVDALLKQAKAAQSR